MKKIFSFIFVITISFYLLAGCSGGGGGSSSTVNDVIYEGQFVDALVEGLNYKTASLSGITDSLGTFQYRKGEQIAFSIGDIPIGISTQGKPLITPLDISSNSDLILSETFNIICFLLSLDLDISDDKITVPVELREWASIENVNVQYLIESLDFNDDLNFVLAAENLLNEFGISYDYECNETIAFQHLKESLSHYGVLVDSQNQELTECPKYNRDEFQAWIDSDGDCQNTRAEVLINESLSALTFSTYSQCTVTDGMWVDDYTGEQYYSASNLDIDHVIPLKEAYDSGAWAWDKETKVEFANYLADSMHLIAVSSAVNRSKGAQDPAEWLPPDESFWIDYAKFWTNIKVQWGLTADIDELNILSEILKDYPDIIFPVEAPEAVCTEGYPEETAIYVPPPAGGGSSGGSSSGGSSSPPSSSCCKICTTGKACGDSCISRSYNCSKPAGCACNG